MKYTAVSVCVQLEAIPSHPLCRPGDAAVALLLDKLGRRRGEVCHHVDRICATLGRARRSVEMALARLVAAGFVERVRDYELRTRRRLILLWRRPPVSAIPCAHSAQEIALTTPPPHTPPNTSWQNTTTKGIGIAPREAAPPTPPPTPEEDPEGEREAGPVGLVVEDDSLELEEDRIKAAALASTRKASRAELEAVKARAAEVFPNDPAAASKAEHDARKYRRLSWVSDAVAIAADVKANSWGFVRKKLHDFAEQGFSDGPPPPPKPKPTPPPAPPRPAPLSPEEQAAELAALEVLASGDPADTVTRLARAELAGRLAGRA